MSTPDIDRDAIRYYLSAIRTSLWAIEDSIRCIENLVGTPIYVDQHEKPIGYILRHDAEYNPPEQTKPNTIPPNQEWNDALTWGYELDSWPMRGYEVSTEHQVERDAPEPAGDSQIPVLAGPKDVRTWLAQKESTRTDGRLRRCWNYLLGRRSW